MRRTFFIHSVVSPHHSTVPFVRTVHTSLRLHNVTPLRERDISEVLVLKGDTTVSDQPALQSTHDGNVGCPVGVRTVGDVIKSIELNRGM